MAGKYASLVVIGLTIVFLFSPVMVIGQGIPSQIVPESCNGPGGCQSVCDIALLAQNILNTGIFLAVFFSAFLFAYAGWLTVTAGGSSENISKAKTTFKNVFIGLIIILVGWIVIDTLMRTVTRADFGPWNKICEAILSHFEHFFA